jgi:hypothetical protein
VRTTTTTPTPPSPIASTGAASATPGGFPTDWPEVKEPGLAAPSSAPSPAPARAAPSQTQARTLSPGRTRSPLIAGSNPRNPPTAAAIAAARAVPTGNEILGRAQKAFNKGDYPEAIRRGKEAIGAGAAAAGHLLLGDAYYHLERYTEAVREYQATLWLEPGNAPARRGRDLARSAAAGGDGTQ